MDFWENGICMFSRNKYFYETFHFFILCLERKNIFFPHLEQKKMFHA